MLKQELVLNSFFVAFSSYTLSKFLSIKDIGNLSRTCTSFLEIRTQMPVLLVEGSDCGTLHHLYKYLRRMKKQAQPHIHARLAIDELVHVDQYLSRDIKTLLLQPFAYNWNPYAVLRDVFWLEEFHQLQHLEISLNKDSAQRFVALLRRRHISLKSLQALVVSTNDVCDGLWVSLTAHPRPLLRVLCVNGFRLQNVPLHPLSCLRYLWISRPSTRSNSFLAGNIARDIPLLKYLTTCDFRGLGRELDPWIACFCQPNTLPELQFWELHESDVDAKDVLLLKAYLTNRPRRHPLTIQGIQMNEQCVHVHPHRILSTLARQVPLHKHRIYRSLDVLEKVLHTKIPMPQGFFKVLKGKTVV